MPKFSSISPLPTLLWSYILLLHMLQTHRTLFLFFHNRGVSERIRQFKCLWTQYQSFKIYEGSNEWNWQREKDRFAITEVSIPLLKKNKLENQDMEDLSLTVNLLYLPLHSSRPGYTVVSSVCGPLSSTDHTLSDF